MLHELQRYWAQCHTKNHHETNNTTSKIRNQQKIQEKEPNMSEAGTKRNRKIVPPKNKKNKKNVCNSVCLQTQTMIYIQFFMLVILNRKTYYFASLGNTNFCHSVHHKSYVPIKIKNKQTKPFRFDINNA